MYRPTVAYVFIVLGLAGAVAGIDHHARGKISNNITRIDRYIKGVPGNPGLKGPKGSKGDSGKNGKQGSRGKQGPAGKTGTITVDRHFTTTVEKTVTVVLTSVTLTQTITTPSGVTTVTTTTVSKPPIKPCKGKRKKPCKPR